MSEKRWFVCKVLLAMVLAVLGVALMVRLQQPQASVSVVLRYVLNGALIMGGVALAVALYAAVSTHFNQWLLGKGATDVDWLWFSSEPKGLVEMRQALPKDGAAESAPPLSPP